VKTIHISEAILEYITQLTEATRNHASIVQGVSPRGALALSKITKARAYLSDRDHVIPEDVIEMFIDTCSHRIIFDQKSNITNENTDQILNELLQNIKTPDIQPVL